MTTNETSPLGSECNAELGPGRCASAWGGRETGPCLYDREEVLAMLFAERERWRALLEARAARFERAAENTEDLKFEVIARVLMSVREDGSRA